MIEAKPYATIAAFSDNHVGHPGQTVEDIEKLGEHIYDASQKSDLILHGGDFCDKGSLQGAHIIASLFKNNNPRDIPIVGVLGNHDREYGQPDYLNRVPLILTHEGGVTLLNGNTYTLKTEEGKIQVVGVPGHNSSYKNRCVSNGSYTPEEFEHEEAKDFANLRRGMTSLRGEGNVLLLHFPFVSTTKPKRIQKRERNFNGNGHAEEEAGSIEHLVYKSKKKLGLVLFGHIHETRYSPVVTLEDVDVINISSPITITMSQGVPYRLIEVPLQPLSTKN